MECFNRTWVVQESVLCSELKHIFYQLALEDLTEKKYNQLICLSGKFSEFFKCYYVMTDF